MTFFPAAGYLLFPYSMYLAFTPYHTLTYSILIDGQWRPGIGDPTVMGWLTVFAYFLTAALCVRTSLRGRGLPAVRRGETLFWAMAAAVFVLLGINKQLDLQSWLTEVGRSSALEQGWYDDRRVVQERFVYAVLGCGVAALILSALLVWGKAWRKYKAAMTGLIFLVTFVVVRAASFHRVDALIRWEWLGVRMNWVLELGGIGCVAAAALWAARALPESAAGEGPSGESSPGDENGGEH